MSAISTRQHITLRQGRAKRIAQVAGSPSLDGLSILSLSLHEPTHPRAPLRRGAGVHPRISVPLLGGVRGGFMVPMHAQKRMEALHEPGADQPTPDSAKPAV